MERTDIVYISAYIAIWQCYLIACTAKPLVAMMFMHALEVNEIIKVILYSWLRASKDSQIKGVAITVKVCQD